MPSGAKQPQPEPGLGWVLIGIFLALPLTVMLVWFLDAVGLLTR